MIHQGTLDERTISETVRHNTLQLWLAEREGRSFDTPLWNFVGRDSVKGHDPTHHLGYVHTKPDKFENATFAVKTDEMCSVHIDVSVFKKFRFRCPH